MLNCPECEKAYSKQTSLNRHLQNHRKSKQYTCSTCHVSFFRRDLLSRHSKMHKSQTSTPTSSSAQHTHVSIPGNQDRQRCHTACVSCRESRTKCDGTQPCTRCISIGKVCEYRGVMNRISQPHRRSQVLFPEPTSETTQKTRFFGDGFNSTSSVWQPNCTAQGQRPDSSNMNLDERESASLPLSQAASSADMACRNTSTSQQCQNESYVQSFEDEENNISNPDLMIGMTDPYLSNLTSDTMAWPWLHETLFLQPENLGIWPEIDTERLMNEEVDREPGAFVQDFRNFDQAIIDFPSSSNLGRDSWPQHRSVTPAEPPPHSDQGILNRNLIQNPKVSDNATSEQRAIVDEIVTQATEPSLFPATKAGRIARWSSLSVKVRDVFALQHEYSENSSHALQIFVDLYLQHFGPLWPLLTRQNLDCDLLHPLLYLTLTSIGGMYGGIQSAHFATLMHCRLRQSLTSSIDFGEFSGDLVWLGQSRLLTQVAALYFGQSQAFSYAQYLGGILVAQARRMNLFKPPRGRDDPIKDVQRPASERLAQWLYLETRRRLAFGILRAETYTSVLLSTRPLISPEEIDLELPYADATWRGPPLPSEIYLAMIERDRASRVKQRFSDIVRLAFERDESPFSLDPICHELLLFGLQQSVWRFSHDNNIFLNLTGTMGSSLQKEYDGLENEYVQLLIANPSVSGGLPTQPAEFLASNSQEDHLKGSPKRMNDLQTDLDRLIKALKRWKDSMKFIRNTISLQQDRNSVLSSLLLYHLSFVRLQAPIEDMHLVSYSVVDKRPVEKQIIDELCEWANSRRANIAVQHACIIWSLINKERQRPEESRAQFNFLAFTGLHHAAVALWTFMGAREGLESQESWFIEPLNSLQPKIAINQSNSKAILILVSHLFNLVGPGRWSSFGAAALKLSECQFPRPE